MENRPECDFEFASWFPKWRYAPSVAVFVLLCPWGVSAQATTPKEHSTYDLPEGASGGFRLTGVKRQDVTVTNVVLTLAAQSPIPQLDLTVTGTTAGLHQSELKPDANATSVSGLESGSRHQITGVITSAAGQSGQISIAGTASNTNLGNDQVLANVPFQMKSNRLTLGSGTTVSGPIKLSAKPTSYTVSKGYTAQGEVSVFLKGVARISSSDVKVEVTAEGISLTKVPSSSVGTAIVTQPIEFTAASGQKGRIITQVTGKTASGAEFVRRSYLYVLADPNGLYTSTSGFIDLDIQKLTADHVASRISENDYTLRMNSVLSGATESSVTNQ